MIQAAQLVAEVRTDGIDSAKSQLQGMGGFVTNIGAMFKQGLGGALSLASNLAGDALGFLKDQLVDSVKVAAAHQLVTAQTVQVLKSTHDASGMTAKAIDDLASSLSRVTPFTQDTVQSGENLLLTFTNIGKKVLPDTTQVMLDMAQAMHQGPEQGAIMLGKALNDPATGLTALTRVGVTFSTQEKDQIKTMMAHNDIVGAQTVMLKELQTEFGGSAQAAGKTFAGALQILKNNMEDIKVKIGTALLPILSDLVKFLDGALSTAFDDVSKAVTYVQNVLKSLNLTDFKDAWQSINVEIGSVVYSFKKMWDAISPLKDVGTDFDPIANAIAGIAKSGLGTVTNLLWDISGAFIAIDKAAHGGNNPFAGLVTGIKEIGQIALNLSPAVNLFDALSRHSQDLGKWFQSSVVPALKEAEPGFANLGHAIVGLLPVMDRISQIVHDTFQKAFDALLPVFEKLIPQVIQISGLIANGLGEAIKFLAPYVEQAVKAIGQFVDEVASRVAPIMLAWANQLQGFLKLWQTIWPYLAPILKGAWDEIVGVVKIAWALVSGLVKIGLDLLSGNWKQAWTDLKDMLGGVWEGIKTYIKGGLEIINGLFGGLPAKALKWGKDFIQGFIDGINQMLGGIGDAAKKVADTISSWLHHTKPEIGPLAEDDKWGADFVENINQGILSGIPKLKSTMGLVAAPLNLSVSGGALASGSSAIASNFAANVAAAQPASGNAQPIILELDGHRVGRVLMPHIADQLRYTLGVHGS